MTAADESAEPLRERSVDVIVLHRDANGTFIETEPGRRLVDLDEELTRDAVADLLGCSVKLTAPAGVPDEIVEAVRRRTVPPAFAASTWLRRHRALVFVDRHCAIGSLSLRYRTELGVYLDDIH